MCLITEKPQGVDEAFFEESIKCFYDSDSWALAFQKLQQWFLQNKRKFPWRHQPTPYKVWVSELMLQQTRAEVVVPYFIRWMEQFPTIRSLASSSEATVMKAWEGLGYYRRARYLLQGARKVVEHFSGNLPNDPQSLASIPGLGKYTVQAILAFAFKKHAAPVDGNVLRVMSRLLSINQSIDSEKTRTNVRNFMLWALPKDGSFLLAEAFIELGACVCKPIPLCGQCPLRQVCSSALSQQQHVYPYRHLKRKAEVRLRWVAVIVCDGKVYLEYRKDVGAMQGLYEFPYEELSSEGALQEKHLLLQQMEKKLGCTLIYKEDLPKQKHQFTHHKITLFPSLLETTTCLKGVWHPISGLDQLPFSSGHRKVKNSLAIY